MKKFTTKLLMSIIAVAFAFVALGTSTYAWFSMNTTVKAEGMQITAKSDSTFLLINSGDNDTLSEVQTAKAILTTISVGTEEAKVYPSAHDTLSSATDAATAAKWYYKVADAPNASASTKDAQALTDANFSKYVIKRTVYITLAPGSNDATNLVVAATFVSNGTATGNSSNAFTPVKAVVACGDTVVELDKTTTSSNTALAATVTASALVTVDIYLYYNGADGSVYTENIANLDGATVNFSFSVTAAQGN